MVKVKASKEVRELEREIIRLKLKQGQIHDRKQAAIRQAESQQKKVSKRLEVLSNRMYGVMNPERVLGRLKAISLQVATWLDINAGKFPADFPEHIAIICGALHKRLEHEDRNNALPRGRSTPGRA